MKAVNRVLWLGWSGIVLGFSACAADRTPAPLPIATPSEQAARATLAPAATRAVTPPPSRAPIGATSPITLTIWLTEEWAASSTPAGRILQDQLSAFQKNNPDLAATIVLKKPTGKGGLLDFLTTTREIVPERLPDLIMLDLAELATAADARLIQPIDDLFAADFRNDLFPFAVEGARFKNAWMGVTFTADVQHVAATSAPPRTWDEFTRQKTAYLAPWGGDDAWLVQYIAQGGVIGETIDPNAAVQVLGFLKRARDLQLVPDLAISTRTVDEGWAGFASGQAALVQVSATRFVNERAKFPKTFYAPIPTRDGRLATPASGWAFAIVTDDPARRGAAARWLNDLMQKERLSAWMRAAQRLPATRGALAPTVNSSEYTAFLRELMERATFVTLSPKQSDAWRAAILAVWKGQLSPEEAARNYLTTIK